MASDRGRCLLIAFWVLLTSGLLRGAEASRTVVLGLPDVLRSVTNQYPPLLAALIERDVAAGRLRSAEGTFDFQTFARAFGNPTGFYENWTTETGFEQFLGAWGSSVFGGYRLNRGDLLPDYDKNRTETGGEFRLGVRVPLLRDGSIDRRRAAVLKARLDRELADPFILRQQLDFVQAATRAYFGWLAAGQQLAFAEDLLRVARDRATALERQVGEGLLPRIVLTDNQRLVVARDLARVRGRRAFEAASLALSLFYRDTLDEPVVAGRDRLPPEFPEPGAPSADALEADIAAAVRARPEMRRLELAAEKLRVDERLARNNLLPSLDAVVAGSQDVGASRYKDKDEFELDAGIEFRLPLQRREARGRLEEAQAGLERVDTEILFARQRIEAEVRDAFSAWQASWEQVSQAQLNVELARELQEAERTRFEQGAADLLALQIREQAAFDARVSAAGTLADCFRAIAAYRAAAALDVAGSETGPEPTP